MLKSDQSGGHRVAPLRIALNSLDTDFAATTYIAPESPESERISRSAAKSAAIATSGWHIT
ncbi:MULTISPECIES: hypothetical protein [Caballeronia]|nr:MULTISPECIES: hypothetical protein [Caballeronia]MDR5791333.1 hypothetical protein [Caballeronia sp. LP003]MDR5795772.1 hypothetical protein [Caballeronia sp. LZ008]